MKLCELYEKSVESEDGRQRGTVLSACVCGGRIARLICCDGEEREFTLETEGLQERGDRLIYRGVRRTYEQRPRTGHVAPGMPAYSQSGKWLGRLQDVVCHRFAVRHAVINGKRIGAARLLFGDAVIVLPPQAGTCAPPREDPARAAHALFLSALCQE